MKKTLLANATLTVLADKSHMNLAVLSGDIFYKIGDNDIPDAEAFVLNEDVRTDRIFMGNQPNKNVYITAGAIGATIQYRLE